MRAGDNVVVMQGVRKRYSRHGAWVLGGVDLALEPGSGVVVVGSNGSGKSTLLRLMVGLTIPTAGVIDRNAHSTAYAPERLAGSIRMSSRLYLSHMAALRHVEPDFARERTETLARQFGLVPGLDAPIRSLSKGNSQKVALMQAFLSPVELIVLDEPFSGLDTGARAALSELLATSIDAGTSVALSSHAPLDVHSRSRIVRILDGQLRDDTTGIADRRVRIRLARTDPGSNVADLRAVPGVVDIGENSAGEVALTAAPGRSDEILRIVLERGWSVRSLSSSYPADNERRP